MAQSREGQVFYSMDEVETANQRAGRHFFDASAKRFFGSRIGQTLYASEDRTRYAFVTSEQPPHGDRAYTARTFDPETAEVGTLGPHCWLSKAQANKLARLWCAGKVPERGEDEGISAYEARVSELVGA